MAVMLKDKVLAPTCLYGRHCCNSDHGVTKKTLRRRQRAREKQALRKER